MKSWVRPARPVSPIVVVVAVLGLWWLVAHNAGAGWVQALGDVAFGMLSIGIFGPGVALARARVRVIEVPTDTTAGAPAAIRIQASTRLRVRPSEPSGDESFVGPVGGRRSPDEWITVVATRRGVVDTLTLEVATAAPFALQWWTRRLVLPLPSPLHVAPRCGRPQALPAHSREDDGESTDWTLSDIGQPRGARPYRSGDSRRQIHWRATAHTGELMVRELERPSAEPITVTVVLPSDPDEADRMAERALGTTVQLLDRGTPVLLATWESSGPVAAPVADRRGAGRRLARAVASGTSTGSVGITASR
jgi:uncharacterized protein (DUF58 family)